MVDPLKASLAISGAGLSAQTLRLRVVSENIANAEVGPTEPGGDPYMRKYVSFATELDRQMGISTVTVDRIGYDRTGFRLVHDPSHIAADENGMVKMPDIDLLTEMADMRETIRSYDANMRAVRQARELISMTIGMMRG